MPIPPGQSIVRLRITLEEVRPVVWRRLLVPGSVRLVKLHTMIQASMGWTDSHLHAFRIGQSTFGSHIDDFPADELDETSLTILQAIRGQRRFVYEYDFGDSWEHEVVVEDITTSPFGLKFGVCLDGQNACPPEDSGGPGGYAQLLEVLADPTDEEYEHFLGWVGGAFDAEAFDLGQTNAMLQRVR
jgi:hypothetical protein